MTLDLYMLSMEATEPESTCHHVPTVNVISHFTLECHTQIPHLPDTLQNLAM